MINFFAILCIYICREKDAKRKNGLEQCLVVGK